VKANSLSNQIHPKNATHSETGREWRCDLREQFQFATLSAMSESKTPPPGKLPGRFLKFQKDFPQVFAAYDALGQATAQSGPLDPKTRALVKLAIAVGSQLEGAIHSHTRRAVEAGCAAQEIRQVILLATTTLGFPAMMKALSCAEDILSNPKP
jgi:alkylhydroperoxidase/carboxymuconolactone decarboxylase family protein YurZ